MSIAQASTEAMRNSSDRRHLPCARPTLLHIVGDSKYGGGSVLISRLSVAAQDTGWHVAVLATDERFCDELTRLGITVVRLDVIRRAVNPIRDVSGAARLYRYLRNSPFDVIHTHTSKAGFVGRLAAHFAGNARIIHTVHGFAFHEFSNPVVLKATAAMERLAAHWCDLIVTVSRFHRELALSLGVGRPDTVIAIPNGIQSQAVTDDATRTETRQKLGIPPSQAMIFGVGRLTKQKGFDLAIRALAIVRRRGRDTVLVVAGEGEESAALQALAEREGVEPYVRFLGFRKDLGALFAAADAVVLPSYREGLSLALLEAMAAAKPIVATQIGSNIEATDNGRCAVLVAPMSLDGLVRGLDELLANPSRCQNLAARARERFVSHYTEELMLRAYLSEYQRLLRTDQLYGRTSYSPDVGARHQPGL